MQRQRAVIEMQEAEREREGDRKSLLIWMSERETEWSRRQGEMERHIQGETQILTWCVCWKAVLSSGDCLLKVFTGQLNHISVCKDALTLNAIQRVLLKMTSHNRQMTDLTAVKSGTGLTSLFEVSNREMSPQPCCFWSSGDEVWTTGWCLRGTKSWLKLNCLQLCPSLTTVCARGRP